MREVLKVYFFGKSPKIILVFSIEKKSPKRELRFQAWGKFIFYCKWVTSYGQHESKLVASQISSFCAFISSLCSRQQERSPSNFASSCLLYNGEAAKSRAWIFCNLDSHKLVSWVLLVRSILWSFWSFCLDVLQSDCTFSCPPSDRGGWSKGGGAGERKGASGGCIIHPKLSTAADQSY